MKAKELAEVLICNPDFDVKVMIQDPTKGWPCFHNCDIKIGDIGCSDKTIYLDAGEVPCKLADTVYTIIGTDEEGYFIDEGKIASFCTEQVGSTMFFVRFECGLTYWYSFKDIGTEVFLSKEDAALVLSQKNIVKG